MAPMISQTRSSTGPIRIFPVKAIREQTEMSNPGKSNHVGRSPQSERSTAVVFYRVRRRDDSIAGNSPITARPLPGNSVADYDGYQDPAPRRVQTWGMDKQELGAFLRGHRERLRPQDAGLPSGPRRRTHTVPSGLLRYARAGPALALPVGPHWRQW